MIFEENIDKICNEHNCSAVLPDHRVQLDGSVATIYATKQSDFLVLIDQPSISLENLLNILPSQISSLVVDSDDYCWIIDSDNPNIERFEIIECCYLDIHVGSSFGGIVLYRNDSVHPTDVCRLTIQNYFPSIQTLHDLEIHHNSTALSIWYGRLDDLRFENVLIKSQSIQLELIVDVEPDTEDVSFVDKYKVEMFLSRMLSYSHKHEYNVKHIIVWVQTDNRKLDAWSVEPSHLQMIDI